ncbi:GNAT family N-acetyltransferase [Flavobacterium sp. Sd200]|uniref:GNAT family N-acetyltransferase n=1 Tax=Flavobacterium sp. Sd200 TaxID=2692211 RepID=UPI001368B67B|nr:GNAT family N-acetyltransferase [Flavobacterium sp. Sd200]MXN92104.1 GNAT family N-acetyltransferase [Flavobacterium sp. Sd200]
MTIADIKFIKATTPEEFETIKELFREYGNSLNFSLDFQDFEKELMTVPQKYASPEGVALLCYYQNIAVGCVGVRKLEENIGEVKRLYVKPEYRSLKLGKKLMELAIEAAAELGYQSIRLDSVKEMAAAINLYKKMGFYEIEAYCYNPLDNPVYMEKKLNTTLIL